MGWVTLTLRKTELKGTHADYQKQLLDISREKRKMAREYHYEQTVVRNDMNQELRDIDAIYDAQKDDALLAMKNATTTHSGGQTTTNQQEYDRAKAAYDEAVQNAERERNEAKTRWEEELAQIEEEANDIETSLDQQQTQIEAQLEAISAEIEAVGSAISSQVQASTIKLG